MEAIVPEPSDSVREAILAALREADGEPTGGWAAAALAEGVDADGDE